MSRYPLMAEPLAIGPVTVRNRFMQSTHTKGYGANGTDSQRTIDYYVERAEGGAGLLFTDAHLVHPTSTVGMTRKTWGFTAESRAFDQRLTSAIKDRGAAVFTQLVHNGLNASADAADDLRVTWGPSAVKSPLYLETPKAMELEDIAEVIEWWGRTAENCREGGFDGVEVHVGHGYLLHQFWSPIYNKRDDEYGGTWENRTRLTREVLAEIRRRTGRDWAVGVRLTATDYVPGGISVEDAARFAASLEADGDIDFVNVTAGDYFDFSLQNSPSDIPDGYNVSHAAQIKAGLKRVPVMVVGGIKDPAHAESILAAGQADMIAMTRAMLADPHLPIKAMEGREDEIVHCIRANQGCMARLLKGFPAGCTVNPAAGRERAFGHGTLKTSSHPGRWLVGGGGPAGLRAAATLAARGHAVVLRERAEVLGGQVNLILNTPGRDTFAWVIKDLEIHARKAGVTIELGTEVTAETVRADGFENVLVATGAQPSSSGFSIANPAADVLAGADLGHVLTAWDVLRTPERAGGNVLILDDEGSRYAAGVAEVLLDRGANVEVVTPYPALFPGTQLTIDMSPLYQRLMGKGLRYRLNTWAVGIAPDEVTLVTLYTGATEVLRGIDTVVLATGRIADDALYLDLKGQVPRVERIGDCVAPRKLDHAIYEGEMAGRELWDPRERYIYDGELETATKWTLT